MQSSEPTSTAAGYTWQKKHKFCQLHAPVFILHSNPDLLTSSSPVPNHPTGEGYLDAVTEVM